MKRVVITGMSVYSPIGNTVEAFFEGAKQGRSGVDAITIFDASTFPCRIGGEVKNLTPLEDKEDMEGMALIKDRKVIMGYHAILDAVKDSGLSPSEISMMGLDLGMGVDYVELAEMVARGYHEGINEFMTKKKIKKIPFYPVDLLNAIVLREFKLKGPSYINTSACAASTQSIGHSFQKIRSGEINLMLTGGSDSMINPLAFGGFALLGALSSDNETPQKACRPFDKTRNGTVLGEGAAFFILEELEHAKARGAKIYAEVTGFGTSMDAHKVTDPHPEGVGAAKAMERAIADAGLMPADISYLNAHGTSTPKNDFAETMAIKKVFGKEAEKLAISSVKSMIGHLIAAGGAVEAVAAVMTLMDGIIPPTINYQVPDPQCELNYTPNHAVPFQGEFVLKNSFAFGGQNACLVLKRFPK